MIICEGGRGERIKGVSTATPYWMLTNRPAYGWVNDNWVKGLRASAQPLPVRMLTNGLTYGRNSRSAWYKSFFFVFSRTTHPSCGNSSLWRNSGCLWLRDIAFLVVLDQFGSERGYVDGHERFKLYIYDLCFNFEIGPVGMPLFDQFPNRLQSQGVRNKQIT
jgi:hypothetical protein